VADLGDRHDVQAGVQLAVPGPGQAVADDVAGRHFDGSGAVERGERRGGAEPADGPDPGEDLACQLGADAVELGERAPGLGDRGGDVLAGRADASIQAADLGDEVGGQSPQCALQRRVRADPAQQLRRDVGGQALRGAGGNEWVSSACSRFTV